MKRIYFIGPLVLLLVFVAVYLNFRHDYNQEEAARVAQAAAELKTRNENDAAARKAALLEAIAAAETRKKERDAKNAREKADREARQLAIDARDRAFREQEKITRQVERVKKDLEAEEAAVAKLLAVRKEADAEREFLLSYVTKSRANQGSLQTVIARLDAPRPAAPAAAN
ncbi:MAG: hypothetical protein NTU80_10670 [Verrucomicrobia bacterium]|nr:hypothetical protein [Verrucomicrobiota bacterium]